jgi:hypothetical protein
MAYSNGHVERLMLTHGSQMATECSGMLNVRLRLAPWFWLIPTFVGTVALYLAPSPQRLIHQIHKQLR